MCGIDLVGLLVALIIIAVAYYVLQFILSKFPLAGLGTVITVIFWALVAIFLVMKVLAPLLNCAGL